MTPAPMSLRILDDGFAGDGRLRDDDVDNEPAAPRGKRVFLETFGCQMNLLDSELVRDQMLSLGYIFVDSDAGADVVLYNTCAVREQSEQKVLSRLGAMQKRKQQQPQLVVGMLGCMAERVGAQLQSRLKHLDVVVGPSELDRLPAMLDDVFAGHLQGLMSTRRQALSGHSSRRSKTLDAAMDRLEALDQGRLVDDAAASKQAYVRITRGCNKFCSFCVVPYTRGPEVHREANAIVDEVKKIVDGGALEVTLLGQTINHYHHGDTSFAQLLARVHDEVPALARLRFLTSYPRDFTDEALDVMASRERISPYLHVPAQSGSDRVLKMMNRGYTRAQYMNLVDRARSRIKDLAIVGDMIVGYPGETDEDFAMSLSLLDDVQYKTVYMFKYSPRPGTVAEKRDADDVSDDVKRARNQAMLEHQRRISFAEHQRMLGKSVEVLVESTAKIDPAIRDDAPRDEGQALVSIGKKASSGVPSRRVRLRGRTRQDHIVSFDGDEGMIGTLATVKIGKATALSLTGELAT